MAIEILKEEGYNHAVDLWSLGVILFEMLFGITPFSADSIWDTFDKVQYTVQFN